MPFVTDFCIPFRSVTNPYLDETRSQSRQWVLDSDLVDSGSMFQYEIARIPELMAMAYPRISATDLRLSCDIMSVMFSIEDVESGKHSLATVASIATRCKAMVAVMYGTQTETEDPVVRAFNDVWHRLCHGMSDRWVERHRNTWEVFIDNHYTWEPVVIDLRGMPTMSEYLRDRGIACGMRVLYDWSERFGGIEIPEEALADPRLDTLDRMVIHTIIGINDTMSYEREIRLGEKVPNLLKVLAHHENLTMEQSIEWARKFVSDAVEEYLSVEYDYLSYWWRSGLSPRQMISLEHRTTDFRNWMSSNYRWHLISPRYGHVPTNPERDRRASTTPSTTTVSGPATHP